MTNRKLPLPLDDPYYRQGNFHGQRHIPTEANQPFRGPMNEKPFDPAPHAALPEHRPQVYFPQEPRSNSDAPPLLPPHSKLPAPCSTLVLPTSHAPASYDYGPYQSQAYGTRQRKGARAQQACDNCRKRKAKCDEGRPSCRHCKDNCLSCVYTDFPHQIHDKVTQLLFKRIQSFEDGVMDRFNRLDQLSTEHGSQFNTLQAKIQDSSAPKAPRTSTVPELMKRDSLNILQRPKAKDDNIATARKQLPEWSEAATDQGIRPGEDGELSIPVEHTTAAHKLLLWPSIQNLLLPGRYDDDYVMKLEEKRGLICVYGRGEGDETSEDNSPSAAPTNSSTGCDEDGSYYAAASPGGPWGVEAKQEQAKLANKGIDENGMLTADADDVHRYYKSYMKHMHQLHPFLDQGYLENRINQFIRINCPQTCSAAISKVPNKHANDFPRGRKRKHSYENFQGTGCDVQFHAGKGSYQRIEYSVHNAIILMVLALGSICEANPVPGPVTDYIVDFRQEIILGPAASDYDPHPQGRNYVINNCSPTSPPLTGDRRTRTGKIPRSQDSQNLKNVDVIPGLAFYAYATQILGGIQGSNGLLHVQAALLAGLYTGQLAHPFQSHGWIHQAARACQVLIRSKRYSQMPDGPIKDRYDFVYWTCLQLESDILAELDLPASGISRSQDRISLPKGWFTLNLPNEISAPSTMMMVFYSAQIHLRKVLNRVHTDLYKVDKQSPTYWSSHIQEVLSMNLESWRNSLPSAMKWKDTDPPSKDINVARMRAKYYGARYIIHRPSLYYALHPYRQEDLYASSDSLPSEDTAMTTSKPQGLNSSLNHDHSVTNLAQLSSGRDPSSGFTRIAHRNLPTKLRRACTVCIDSAMLSTVAFDGIEGRPVVTNIFGTAHAQFGNMLVLSATYMSSLSELVDGSKLEELLRRTIKFLLQSRNISPSLRADARILTEIYEKIFGPPRNQA
ncbi:hypothetical protein BDV26DRAFT_304778 [Aspergillus bertholletiae]|uniref:Zn(2)-C6 fungal-type domain-containing protein n=1 Tax=Aspergillus bertholletiae TaxID=1226010 RepID=A0A5N7B7R5_9EURO|nr:hypothetical protein BDV26DRAFT_304778 [Aspergillus bertholletiae]